MILQVATDAGQIRNHRRSGAPKMCRISDAGSHQHLGRIHRTGTKHDFTSDSHALTTALVKVLDAHDAPALDNQSGRLRG